MPTNENDVIHIAPGAVIDGLDGNDLFHWTGGSATIEGGALNAVSIFCILKCRLCLIPDSERPAYRWWNAWMHPTKFRILPWR